MGSLRLITNDWWSASIIKKHAQQIVNSMTPMKGIEHYMTLQNKNRSIKWIDNINGSPSPNPNKQAAKK